MRFGLQCEQLDVFHSERKSSASGLRQMIAWALQLLVGGAERSVRVHLYLLVLIGQYQGRSPTIGCCGAETLELLESELADEINRRPTHTHTHTYSQCSTHHSLHFNTSVSCFMWVCLCLFILPCQRFSS